VPQRGYPGRHGTHWAAEKRHQIQRVNGLVDEYASPFGGPAPTPRAARVVLFIAVPEHFSGNHQDVPEHSCLQGALHLTGGGVQTVLQADAEPHILLPACGDGSVGLLCVGRQRLFHQDVLAGPRRLLDHRGMQIVRRADRHRVYVGSGQQFGIVPHLAGDLEPRSEIRHPLWDDITASNQLCIRQGRQQAGVHFPDDPAANDCTTHSLLHTTTLQDIDWNATVSSVHHYTKYPVFPLCRQHSAG